MKLTKRKPPPCWRRKGGRRKLYIERIAEMKEIVNVVLKGQFYCDGKELFFHDAEKTVTKKLAALVGSRLIRDGELRFSVVDNQAEEARS